MPSLPRFYRTHVGPAVEYHTPVRDAAEADNMDGLELIYDQCCRLQEAIDALVREKVAEQRRADALQEAVNAYKAMLEGKVTQ